MAGTFNSCEQKLTKNFKRSEFACKGMYCCSESAPVSRDLVQGLQELRDLSGHAIQITSGFRCVTHNQKIKGATASYHTLGQAADVKSKHHTPHELAKLAETIPIFRDGGIGIYDSWVHLDIRNKKARWIS